MVKEGSSSGILAIVSSAEDSFDDAGLLNGVRVPILNGDVGKRSFRKRILDRTRREKRESRVSNEGSG